MKLHNNPINIVNADDPLDFPIYVLQEGVELPKTGNYYLITGDGFWLHKDTGLAYGFVKVDSIGFMKPMAARMGLKIPKVPVAIIWQSLTFFRNIYEKHKTESILVLVYSKEQQGFGLICPDQQVCHSSIKYSKDFNVPDHLNVIGTFHSHCNFHSFHSHVDCDDEKYFDGLHVTFGNVDSQEFSLTASIVINGNRAQIPPEEYLDGIGATDKKTNMYKFTLTKNEVKSLNRQYGSKLKQWFGKVKPISDLKLFEPPGSILSVLSRPVENIINKQRMFHED